MTQQHSRLTLEATEGAHGEVAQRIALELMEWAAQRAELLEALKYARQELHNIGNDEGWGEIDYPIINQAITKAEAAE